MGDDALDRLRRDRFRTIERTMTLKEIVKNKTASFKFYRDGELWYETDDGFDFPIPIGDTGTGVFNAEEKAIRLMRWIRRQLEVRGEWEKERQAHARNLSGRTP